MQHRHNRFACGRPRARSGKPVASGDRTPAHRNRSILAVLPYFCIALNIAAYAAPSHARLNPGDALVIDVNAGTNKAGALFSVNPSTGTRTLVSDFGNGVQGPLGESPFGVTLDASNNALVIDAVAGTNGVGALFSVNPATGARSLVSDFGNSGQGPLGADPSGLTLDASGNVLVIDGNAGTNGAGALFSVNPSTGMRTLVSDFGNGAQGPIAFNPSALTLDASGGALVTDPDAGTSNLGALFRVNPSTGMRTLVSDFGNDAQGPPGTTPRGLTLDASGNVLVIDGDAGTNGAGALFSVNPATGARTLVSDFGDGGLGPLGADPFGVALDASRNALVIDGDAGTRNLGALFSVNPTTGARTLVSDFGSRGQGPRGADPFGVAVVPAGAAPTCDGRPVSQGCTVNDVRNQVCVGSPGKDTISGTPGRDVIQGLAGDDAIRGLGGDDIICGGDGNDILEGNKDQDRLFGEKGNDTLNGNSGEDALDGGPDRDTCRVGGIDKFASCETVIRRKQDNDDDE